MAKTTYQNLEETDSVQIRIMLYVAWWVRNRKIPIPRKEIVVELTKHKIGRGTTDAALHALIIKGFIRKGYAISNKTSYVMLRAV